MASVGTETGSYAVVAACAVVWITNLDDDTKGYECMSALASALDARDARRTTSADAATKLCVQ